MTTTAPSNRPVSRWLPAFLVLALLLRVVFGLLQDTQTPYTNLSADGYWYLKSGLELVSGADFLHLPTAPVYMLFAGWWQQLLPGAGAIIGIRLVQALLGTFTCYLAFLLARRVTGTERAGLIAAGVLAVSPVFVIEAAQVATETLYLTLIAAGITVYVMQVDRAKGHGWRSLVWVALLFGLATLTRAVSLLFPVGLALHLLMLYGWRAGLRRAAVLLLAYALVVSTWTIYNVVRFDRWVVGAEGLAAFLYIGATSYTSPQDVDERLSEDASEEVEIDATQAERQEAYIDAAGNVIGRDPGAYIRHRVGELARAYVQPHGTVFFPGDSLRTLAAGWLRDDRSFGGLLALTRADAFWPKLVVYIFHYVGLVAGLAGMWLYRRRWRVALPLIGFIIYTTLVHLVLLALPRYIFPTELFWWVFAAGLLARQRGAAPASETEPAR